MDTKPHLAIFLLPSLHILAIETRFFSTYLYTTHSHTTNIGRSIAVFDTVIESKKKKVLKHQQLSKHKLS